MLSKRFDGPLLRLSHAADTLTRPEKPPTRPKALCFETSIFDFAELSPIQWSRFAFVSVNGNPRDSSNSGRTLLRQMFTPSWRNTLRP